MSTVEHAAQVLEREETRLMAIEGVHGVAVGLSQQNNGDDSTVVIKIFVAGGGVPPGLPRQLEGVPVEIVETEGFRAAHL